MKLGEKIRYLREVEGSLRGLGRPMTQLELIEAVRKEQGKTIFLNMAVESALMYCRVLLNFLGIYKLQKHRALESRAPQPNFRESEVWIERFPHGRLLSTTELCRLTGGPMHPRTIRS